MGGGAALVAPLVVASDPGQRLLQAGSIGPLGLGQEIDGIAATQGAGQAAAVQHAHFAVLHALPGEAEVLVVHGLPLFSGARQERAGPCR